MKKIFLVLISLLIMSCGTDKKEVKEPSVYKFEEWIPIMIKDGETTKYFDFENPKADTLDSGETFKAKLYMGIKEYYDSLGQNIILKEQKMSFRVNGIDLNKFLTIKSDTGLIEIPVDSILNKIETDSAEWRASIMPTNDSTYVIVGLWYFKRKK